MKWRDSWLGTLADTAPLIFGLLPHLEPDLELSSLAHLDARALMEDGIRGMIWDVDGTLLPPDGAEVPASSRRAVEEAMTAAGLRHVIVSNAEGARQRRLALMFPDIPILRVFVTNSGIVYHRRLGEVEWWSRDHEGPSTPGMRPVRKPSLVLFRFALQELGVERPSEAIMIGDQHITDVAPANLLGMRSLLVGRCAPERYTRPVRLLQWGDARLAGLVSILGSRAPAERR